MWIWSVHLGRLALLSLSMHSHTSTCCVQGLVQINKDSVSLAKLARDGKLQPPQFQVPHPIVSYRVVPWPLGLQFQLVLMSLRASCRAARLLSRISACSASASSPPSSTRRSRASSPSAAPRSASCSTTRSRAGIDTITYSMYEYSTHSHYCTQFYSYCTRFSLLLNSHFNFSIPHTLVFF